ncbi:MAG: glycosyltransferase, partial [Verrucomicrobiae bacterium]|nr:glycosyltransferase [Verrucomicrobiae bacterium]
VASLANVKGFFREAEEQDRRWAPGLERNRQRQAAVIVAIKGVDPDNTPRFFEALRSQDYRRYRLILAMESEDDPIASWLKRTLELDEGCFTWESGKEEGLTEIELVVAGHAQTRGQKVQNQMAAFERLRPEDEIVAFADADIHCGPDWLARLLAPINTGTNPVATTYRYLIPKRPSFVNHVASVINASVATLGGPDRWSSLWGGSMAIARRDFDALDVPHLFSGSLNDDLRLGRAARRSGRRVAFVRSLLMPSPVDFSWASFFEFGRRQYYQVRHFAPIFYKVSHLLTWVYTIGFASAISVILFNHSKVAWGVLGVVFCCDQLRAWQRWQIVRHLFDASAVEALRGSRWIEHLLTPFWMGLHALITTSAWFADHIHWAGIGYRVHAEDRTEVMGRAGE